MSAMFRSFSVFNYRVWFIGALVSNVGAWMQATAISWVVLTELTDNDAAAMGVTMALQFGPPLLLVGVTGWVADRFDRRRLLMVTQGLLLRARRSRSACCSCRRDDPAAHVRLRARARRRRRVRQPGPPGVRLRHRVPRERVERRRPQRGVLQRRPHDRSRRRRRPDRRGRHRVGVPRQRRDVPRDDRRPAAHPHEELIPRVQAPGSSRLADGFRYVAQRPDSWSRSRWCSCSARSA